jgi:hypothetical protein
MSVKPWEINWCICRADAHDVAAAKEARQEGKKIAVPNVGDEFWRVPLSIGPLSVEHDHWAHWHISGPVEDAVMASYAPVFEAIIKELLESAYIPGPRRKEITAVLAAARTAPKPEKG